MRERAHLDAVNDPENNAWHGWSENDWRFSMVGQARARIELSMALCRGRWEITVAVIGFLTAGLISAFLPLVPGVYAHLPDVASTTALFATGLIEYLIMRVATRLNENGKPMMYMYRRAARAVNISKEEYERKKEEQTFDPLIVYCVGDSIERLQHD